MTLEFRPRWRKNCTPFDMPVPSDPNPAPGVNWLQCFEDGVAAVHTDAEDCLNADQTHGPYGEDGTYKAGPSSIRFAYGADDLDAMIVLDQAVRNRALHYDLAHQPREGGFAWYASDMTRDIRVFRRVIALADRQKAEWDTNVTNDGPGWYPPSVAQLLMKAHQSPGTGLELPEGIQARALGWLHWTEAMAHKVYPGRDREFAEKLLEVSNTAVMQETGQFSYGPHVGIDQPHIFYVFHQTIWMMGFLALNYRLGNPVPQFALNYGERLHELPTHDYYGSDSLPAFNLTVDGHFEVATGTEQQGDPAAGFSEDFYAVLHHLTRDPKWLEYSCKFGVSADTVDEKRVKLAALTDPVTRQITTLMRGQLLN